MTWIQKTKILVAALALMFWNMASAQEDEKGYVSGNFQVDGQTYRKDSLTGAEDVPEQMLINAFGNLRYTYGKLTAGLRFEAYLNTLQGISKNYDGTGIPYKYFTYRNEELEFTVGNFYEQFGTGVSLRAYEDKMLGIDNAFEGVLTRYNPVQGIFLKGLVGKQRNYFSLGPGIVRGIDGEMNLNETFRLDSLTTQIIIGGSFVSKYQPDRNPTLILPENVSLAASRLNLQHNGFSLQTEYAYKINDPSADNLNNYQPGQVLISDLSYNTSHYGVLVGFKWINNMSFRSDRAAQENQLLINYLPSITRNHVYSLAAMYPYATQLNGEAGVKGEIFYRFQRETFLGGKYGTLVTISYSRVNNIDTTNLPMWDSVHPHPDHYKTKFLSVGDTRYFEDFAIEIQKKISPNLNSTWQLQYTAYNKKVLEGKDGMIEALIAIADITYKFRPQHSLRTEFQYLNTKQDHGDWFSGTLEYTVSPHFFVAIVDQYNFGNPEADRQLHYYMVRGGYTRGANRIQVGYGRQRMGVICIGGVCRIVPASTGFNFSISSTF
ncbi:MAG TPA: DUF6029 family protein [Salinivirgaceae bacterium]|nr:DUF6029 family protein [Salinivirgaceae bacterium]